MWYFQGIPTFGEPQQQRKILQSLHTFKKKALTCSTLKQVNINYSDLYIIFCCSSRLLRRSIIINIIECRERLRKC